MMINGKKISEEILEKLKKLPKPGKTLAAVLVGENPASISFIKQKEKAAGILGVSFKIHKLSAELSQSELRAKVAEIAVDPAVGGIILQLPLPSKFNRKEIISAIPEIKDPDALKESNTLALPPAVETVKIILGKIGFDLAGKRAVILGRGLLVGKPVAKWLNGKAAEVLIFGSDADPAQLRKALSEADLIITGVGKAGLISPENLKTGAAVIDFGYSRDAAGKIHGDFDSQKLEIRNSGLEITFYTPTPGGTGPILVAALLKNFYKLNPPN